MIQRFLLTILVTGLIAGCSSSQGELTAYRAEAKAYCEAHKPEYWIRSGRLAELNAMNPTDKARALIKEFRLSVTSKEMATIIFNEGGKLPAKDFYPFLQKKIPELTKEPFNCPEIPEFYISQ